MAEEEPAAIFAFTDPLLGTRPTRRRLQVDRRHMSTAHVESNRRKQKGQAVAWLRKMSQLCQPNFQHCHRHTSTHSLSFFDKESKGAHPTTCRSFALM